MFINKYYFVKCIYTIYWYGDCILCIDMEYIQRLKKIEGQVRGVISMIEQNRECEDILIQLAAIRSGITKVMVERLKERLIQCLTEARDKEQVKADFINILNKLMKFMG